MSYEGEIWEKKNGIREVKNFYDFAVRYFAKEFNVPEKEFPTLKILRGRCASYRSSNNTVRIGDEEDFSEIGDIVGEELGHFMRDKLMKRVGKSFRELGEQYVDEFYGFLGSKILYKVCSNNQRKKFFEGDRTFELDYNDMNYKEQRHDFLLIARRKGLKAHSKYEKPGYDSFFSGLIHIRPYHFASDLDLDKVPNLRELYSCSDRETKRRFFRENKIYDFGITTRKFEGLEKKVAIILIAAISLFVINYTGITGNIVGNNFSYSFQKILLIISILCCFLFGALLLNKFIKQSTIQKQKHAIQYPH